MAKITVQDIQSKKEKGKRIVALTAYDYSFARLVDEAGMDIVLVGDSLGMVMLGEETTLTVTMSEMTTHTRAVAKAVQRALVVADMPYRSYDTPDLAFRHARILLDEGHAQAVKLEGGDEKVAAVTQHLRRNGVEVMGHIGLTPQSIERLGGYKVQGKTPQEVSRLLQEAAALEKAGVFAIVLECIPKELAKRITQSVRVPTIGIGAGPHCDGQVLVLYDVLGLYDKIHPRFVRAFAPIRQAILDGLRSYKHDVEVGEFPSDKESFE